jgi:hypothetical protein
VPKPLRFAGEQRARRHNHTAVALTAAPTSAPAPPPTPTPRQSSTQAPTPNQQTWRRWWRAHRLLRLGAHCAAQQGRSLPRTRAHREGGRESEPLPRRGPAHGGAAIAQVRGRDGHRLRPWRGRGATPARAAPARGRGGSAGGTGRRQQSRGDGNGRRGMHSGRGGSRGSGDSLRQRRYRAKRCRYRRRCQRRGRRRHHLLQLPDGGREVL